MSRILNITVADLPQPMHLLDISQKEEEMERWIKDIDRLVEIALEALELFTEANQRIETALRNKPLAQKTALAAEETTA